MLSPGRRAAAARFWIVFLMAACDRPELEVGRVQEVGDRLIHHIAWDTVYSIGGSAEDTTLLKSRLITARDGQLYAYDYGDDRLKSFDSRGRLRWSLGGPGGGPGEFRNPTELVVGPNGNVWVTDAGAARITVVTPDGALGRHIPFHGRPILRAIPVGADQILVFTTTPEHLWVLLEGEEQVVETGALPTSELQITNPAVRAPFVSVSQDARIWAVGFPLAAPLLVYADRQLRCVGRLVEGTAEFPEAYRRDTPIWAVGLAASESSVFVLARGQTEEEFRVLDEYSTENCNYLRSLRLPRKLQSLTYDGETFYFYYEEPAPTILALRPRLDGAG